MRSGLTVAKALLLGLTLSLVGMVPGFGHAATPGIAPDKPKAEARDVRNQVAKAAPSNPRLATLQLEVWPEYDRPGVALVILRAEVAADVPLPASVSMRLPRSAPAPAQVAYSAPGSGGLLNLKHDRTEDASGVILRFTLPERTFHVEFYDTLRTRGNRRTYVYAWGGDFAADQLGVVVQEPASASDVTVEPALANVATGPDGLRYRSAELGASPAGKAREISVGYAKSDERTSAEILKLGQSQGAGLSPQTVPSQGAALPGPAAAAGSEASGDRDVRAGAENRKEQALLVVAMIALATGLGTFAWWWMLRRGSTIARFESTVSAGTTSGTSSERVASGIPVGAVRDGRADSPGPTAGTGKGAAQRRETKASRRAAREAIRATHTTTAAATVVTAVGSVGFGQNAPAADRDWTLVFAAWVVAATATLGALFASEVMALAPCVLCWYQRIFMFPLAVMLPLSLFPFDRGAVRYALPLAAGGLAVALWHLLIVWGVVSESLSPCTQGVPCKDVQVQWLGFNIPLLSFVAFALILALLLVSRRRRG